MKSTKHLLSILLLLCLSFTSCDIDDGLSNNNNQQQEIPNSFSEYYGNEISRDFIGTVVDKNQLPIPGALISIGNDTALTDSNGVFIIRDANVNKRFGYVKAEKVGYIHASRSVVPTDGTNKVNIMMLDANITGSVNSGSTGTVSLSNGSSVSFDGNFIKEDGSAYSGSVDVIMHHLDPADESMAQQMPGMLYAQNEEGAERMLQTLGMLAVELRGSGGEDLNLAEGSTSEIKIPVDASLMSIAPATIPLWYFDEVNGYWKEEGQATLQGNMYVGTVSHFSFWNCDIPAEAITLCVNLVDQYGNELSMLNISITSIDFGTTNGVTNERGQVCGFVPSNESLILYTRLLNSCGSTVLQTETIGPFSSDTDITIILESELETETVVGILNNCEGESVTNGYIEITHAGTSTIEFIDNGVFEINLIKCDNLETFSLIGVNLDNIETSSVLNSSFNSPITDVGTITACISQEEYIQYLVDDEINVLFLDDIHVDLFENSFVVLRHWYGESINKFLIDAPIEIGSYNTETSDNIILNFTYSNNYILGTLDSEEGLTINVNYVGSGVGDYIDFDFSGNFTHQGIQSTVVGSAHVRIDE